MRSLAGEADPPLVLRWRRCHQPADGLEDDLELLVVLPELLFQFFQLAGQVLVRGPQRPQPDKSVELNRSKKAPRRGRRREERIRLRSVTHSRNHPSLFSPPAGSRRSPFPGFSPLAWASCADPPQPRSERGRPNFAPSTNLRCR